MRRPSSFERRARLTACPRQVRVGTSVAVDGRRRGLVLMVDQGEREGLMYIVKRFKTDHEQDEELMDETKVDP